MMTHMKIGRVIAVLSAVPAFAVPALAQPVGGAPQQSHWLGVVLAIVLVICIGVASLRGSKRGHMD